MVLHEIEIYSIKYRCLLSSIKVPNIDICNARLTLPDIRCFWSPVIIIFIRERLFIVPIVFYIFRISNANRKQQRRPLVWIERYQKISKQLLRYLKIGKSWVGEYGFCQFQVFLTYFLISVTARRRIFVIPLLYLSKFLIVC